MHAAKPTAGPRSKALHNGCNENDTRSHDRGASGRELFTRRQSWRQAMSFVPMHALWKNL